MRRGEGERDDKWKEREVRRAERERDDERQREVL